MSNLRITVSSIAIVVIMVLAMVLDAGCTEIAMGWPTKEGTDRREREAKATGREKETHSMNRRGSSTTLP